TERSERSGVRRGLAPRNRLQPVRLSALKQRRDLSGRTGPSEEEALGPLTAELAKRLDLGLGLHTLGHDAQIEGPGHPHDRVDDRRVLPLRANAVDEAAVDLQHVDREALQVAERGVTGAEV